MNRIKRATTILGLLTSGSAMAHTGDHGYSGFLHFLTQPDHLLMLAVAGVVGTIALIKMAKVKKDRG